MERARPKPTMSQMADFHQVRQEAPRRRVDIAWLRRNGDIALATQAIPAVPIFEDCFAAFAHGTLIQTQLGPVAIEDILPGDQVLTLDHGTQPVLWRGSLTCVPSNQDRCRSLTRVTADGFGIGRPARDLLIGPGGRILRQAPRGLAGAGCAQALVSVSSLQDGASVIAVSPPGPAQLYHLCLPVHAVLRAGGLDMESCHPGISLRSTLPDSRALAQFLALFPYIDQPGDFGPLSYPRLPGKALQDAPVA
ncbi:Hint domain-containing protein [Lutimaribacter sp. EGI FJ00015]|uniref:Hint domain-containing protein n=1 Tax=Lutimaribacter degradans TaxID=2945989 RepID=A0ACC5ZZX2_9RHOB|nr:Hint domain-containing protein [Lutimaribacter sp. EGI FJ00013]MCM2563301.1 Hint domain-containing protein [Lutimaribacter sp. EGI FJ00013]MCO0614376.1 Hint domain-containing protein [Lutimaribacter sp. EGI FJ00015]MCO0636023.1 Hint domain-containing protein [Lutimaribacter sp. EGI FJ00014]